MFFTSTLYIPSHHASFHLGTTPGVFTQQQNRIYISELIPYLWLIYSIMNVEIKHHANYLQLRKGAHLTERQLFSFSFMHDASFCKQYLI